LFAYESKNIRCGYQDYVLWTCFAGARYDSCQRSAVPFLPCQEHQNALGEKGTKLAKFPNVFAKALATETTHHKGTAQP